MNNNGVNNSKNREDYVVNAEPSYLNEALNRTVKSEDKISGIIAFIIAFCAAIRIVCCFTGQSLSENLSEISHDLIGILAAVIILGILTVVIGVITYFVCTGPSILSHNKARAIDKYKMFPRLYDEMGKYIELKNSGRGILEIANENRDGYRKIPEASTIRRIRGYFSSTRFTSAGAILLLVSKALNIVSTRADAPIMDKMTMYCYGAFSFACTAILFWAIFALIGRDLYKAGKIFILYAIARLGLLYFTYILSTPSLFISFIPIYAVASLAFIAFGIFLMVGTQKLPFRIFFAILMAFLSLSGLLTMPDTQFPGGDFGSRVITTAGRNMYVNPLKVNFLKLIIYRLDLRRSIADAWLAIKTYSPHSVYSKFRFAPGLDFEPVIRAIGFVMVSLGFKKPEIMKEFERREYRKLQK